MNGGWVRRGCGGAVDTDGMEDEGMRVEEAVVEVARWRR
jgi:hypothetical protein